jgi:tetratricopeptide (TPR) repeat protein
VVEQKPIARKFPPLLPERVSLSRLPVTGRDLFGREEEFALLDRSWEDETINVISFVAWGGVGKSALVNHWLRGMRRDNYRGAERVYAWSFYQQGVGDRAVSADQFVDAALRWFGDPDPTAGSPWDKGERLARLVRNQRTLLLLDGLEPLQFPPGPDEGRFKDQAMQALLRELASFNPGMCVITSRISPTDLADYEGDTVLSVNLENLSPQTGAAMLSAQGVKGTQAELEEASDEFGGHALALTLLGGYLTNVYDGDVRQRDKVRILREDEERGGLTQALMASYEKWFAEESPELAILRLLGLFDRPADAASIASVRAAPAIQGLTDTLQDLSDEQWQRSLRRLREANLVSDRDPQQPDALDAHPLIREYFRGQLKQRNPDAWREGNSRLFEHLRSSTVEFPETLEEMMPLYAAVGYGCEAGRHQEVFTTVYLRRILREQRNFSVRNLGAFGAELAALTSFFDPPWQRPVEGLSESDKGFVMSQAGNCLRALGRLAEAAQPLSYALETQTRMSNWEAASLVAANFNRLQLTVGDISGALDYAGRCVEFAERSGSILWTAAGRAVLADTLHHAGRMSEAENIFREVEETQKRSRPEAAFLVSLHGFNYCDLLLDEGKYAEARVRAEASLALAEQNHWLLELALGYLSLGRADLLEAKQEGARDFVRPAQLLDRAVSLFRQAGQLDYLPHGLLARAELFRALGDFGRARADVEEAMSIATRGGMRLHQADCHLEFARLLSAQDDKPKAREHLLKAREMIERMGYHRRDEAVREIEAWLEEAGE